MSKCLIKTKNDVWTIKYLLNSEKVYYYKDGLLKCMIIDFAVYTFRTIPLY